jgi:hypothetical protein
VCASLVTRNMKDKGNACAFWGRPAWHFRKSLHQQRESRGRRQSASAVALAVPAFRRPLAEIVAKSPTQVTVEESKPKMAKPAGLIAP